MVWDAANMRRAILMGFVALLSSFEAAALSPGLEHRTSTGIAGVVTLAGSPSQRTGKNIPDNLPPPPGGGSSPFSNRNPVQQQQLPQPWAAIPEFIMRDSKACLGMLKGNWAQYLQNDRNWREFDKCLLVESQYKTGRMPNLFNGKVEVWGRASYSYNCYGYAAKPEHPEGWVGPKFNHQGQIVQGHIPIPPDRPQALLEYFTKRHGWKPMALDLSSPRRWARNVSFCSGISMADMSTPRFGPTRGCLRRWASSVCFDLTVHIRWMARPMASRRECIAVRRRHGRFPRRTRNTTAVVRV